MGKIPKLQLKPEDAATIDDMEDGLIFEEKPSTGNANNEAASGWTLMEKIAYCIWMAALVIPGIYWGIRGGLEEHNRFESNFFYSLGIGIFVFSFCYFFLLFNSMVMFCKFEIERFCAFNSMISL